MYSVTGCTSNSTSETTRETTIETINGTTANTASGGVYTWDQLNGMTASCTGTIYGIYDLSGGLWERTTGYVANGTTLLSSYGKSIAYNEETLKTISTKYTTVYPHDSETDKQGIENNNTNINTASNNDYALNTLIYGDGIRETSTGGTGNTSWYGDESVFPGLYMPFSVRGNRWDSEVSAGFFSFIRTNGSSYYDGGFRATVIVP